MVVKKPRIVIIGAGMAGLTAANKLHSVGASKELFEVCVVEGGNRIGGRINTSEFGGDRVEMGATWIHGIRGSPIHKIAQQIHALESDQPWECMDGNENMATTIAEGGFVLNPSVVDPITKLFNNLMDHVQGKILTTKTKGDCGNLSIGSFLRRGLDAYWGSTKAEEELEGFGKWSSKSLDEAIFAMHENTQRTNTSAADLFNLDFSAESEYQMFPGDETTIAKGYLSIIESLASVLPPGLVQLGRKVTRIEWQPESNEPMNMENGTCSRPVKLHFCDGSIVSADHVIVTVSLGVLKASIRDDDSGMLMFHPPLPSFKAEAISRLGFGVVNKLFMQLSSPHERRGEHEQSKGFPFLQMVFHSPHSELRHKKIPWWMRRIATLSPIYNNSSVLLSWFAGEEALALESLKDEEIIKGVSDTISCFLFHPLELCNGNVSSEKHSNEYKVKFSEVLKTQWGTDPLFLGSYSHVAIGSSGDDLDTLAEPLPKFSSSNYPSASPPLQILFAGEATHRTYYSTTHGAYFSGLREATRLLQHYSLC